MSRYYILHKETREEIRVSSSPFNIDESVQPDAPYIQLKEVIDEKRPNVKADEKLERETVDDDNKFERIRRMIAVPKTQAELDAEAAAAAIQADREQIKQMLTALKNGEGTTTVRLARVERVLFRLAKDSIL